MTQTLGIIGSGMIGGAVARLAVGAGLDVVLSNSRGPETLRELADSLGPRARTATAEEAAREGDWVLVAVPFSAVPHLPVEALVGKVVIDANNYYPARDGLVPELEAGTLTAGELFARQLPGARTVKVFSTIFFRHLIALARPAGSPERSALPVIGDDAAAKTSVTALIDRLGYDSVDVGGTAESWRVQAGSPAYVAPYLTGTYTDWTQDPGSPVSAARLREVLDGAPRPR